VKEIVIGMHEKKGDSVNSLKAAVYSVEDELLKTNFY
jgi:hypothetical protein